MSGGRLLHDVTTACRKARFGMACFWAPDSLFGATEGVVRTRVGYAGGTSPNPTYRNIGDHTESIEIDYDPNIIDYNALLKLFWENHDPTAKNKKQYTSIIFYFDEDQKTSANESIKAQEKKRSSPLVTTLIPAKEFYDAEDYHQKYRLQGHSSLCEAIGLTPNNLKTSTLAARLNGYVIGCGGVAQFERELPTLGLDDSTAEYVRKLVTRFEGTGLVC